MVRVPAVELVDILEQADVVQPAYMVLLIQVAAEVVAEVHHIMDLETILLVAVEVGLGYVVRGPMVLKQPIIPMGEVVEEAVGATAVLHRDTMAILNTAHHLQETTAEMAEVVIL